MKSMKNPSYKKKKNSHFTQLIMDVSVLLEKMPALKPLCFTKAATVGDLGCDKGS